MVGRVWWGGDGGGWCVGDGWSGRKWWDEIVGRGGMGVGRGGMGVGRGGMGVGRGGMW